MTTTRRHDTKIAPQILSRNRTKLHTVVADKGYDDNKLRTMLRTMGIKPLIRRRRFGGCVVEEGGELLRRRCLVETANSVVKRRYGEAVGSRRWDRQFKEVLGKHVIYNIELALRKGFVVLFLVFFDVRRYSAYLCHSSPPSQGFYRATILDLTR